MRDQRHAVCQLPLLALAKAGLMMMTRGVCMDDFRGRNRVD
jgi:hypothetical protein